MIDYKKIPLGALPSPVDTRDKRVEDLGISMSSFIPKEYIQPYKVKVTNQGPYGMCVAFAAASVVEALEYQERGIQVEFSKAWIYGNRADNDHQDEGMYPRQALKQLARFGTPPMEMFPIINNYPTCKKQMAELMGYLLPNAVGQKIKGYIKLRGLDEIRKFIYTYNCPVLITVEVVDSFYNVGKDGVMPPKSGNFLGNHAMICNGNEITLSGTSYYDVQNSWGDDWGKGGSCYIDPTTYQFKEAWGLVNETPQNTVSRPREMLMTIGNNNILFDNKIKTVPQGPIIYNDKTMVPVRELCEALGYKVKYYPSGHPEGKGSLVYIGDGGEYLDMGDIQ